jgi:hypothetical protein
MRGSGWNWFRVMSYVGFGISSAESSNTTTGVSSIKSNGGCLSGVMVSVLAIGPKVRRFRPSQVDGFLRAIKIHSMPSFRGEVKLSAPCQDFTAC